MLVGNASLGIELSKDGPDAVVSNDKVVLGHVVVLKEVSRLTFGHSLNGVAEAGWKVNSYCHY